MPARPWSRNFWCSKESWKRNAKLCLSCRSWVWHERRCFIYKWVSATHEKNTQVVTESATSLSIKLISECVRTACSQLFSWQIWNKLFASCKALAKRAQHRMYAIQLHVGLVWPPCWVILDDVGWRLNPVKHSVQHRPTFSLFSCWIGPFDHPVQH